MTEQEPSYQSESVSDKTSLRLSTVKGVYARRVRLSLTRKDADMLRQILTRLSGDPVARSQVGMPRTPKSSMIQAARMHRLVDRAIVKRDRAMKAKLGRWPDDGDLIVMDERLAAERRLIAAPADEDVPFIELSNP